MNSEHLSSEQPSPKTKKSDPRHIITADAFKVDEALIGLPLATPKKRALAMVIDLLLIQQLSHVGSAALGLATVTLLYLLSRKKGRKSVGTLRSTLFKILAILALLYVIVTEYLSYQEVHSLSFLNQVEEQAIVQVEDKVASLTPDELIENLRQENRVLKANDESDIIDILEALAHKFGYGFGWAGLYFTLLVYLLKGQTVGKWLMRIKIIQLDGQSISVWSAFGRYGGYAASVVTGLSGFIQIVWDPNRQGMHDKVSSTVVVNV